MLQLNVNTRIENAQMAEPVRRAAAALQRDLTKVFVGSEAPGATIRLVQAEQAPEQYALAVQDGALEIRAADALGFVYGIYEVSRSILGVQDFWFWNDQPFAPQAAVELPEDYSLQSKPCRVRFRGWFVNDEVLLHTWKVDASNDKAWEMVFEALLRCRGNMVIPGTGNCAQQHSALASAMGLYLTHHHAEPLGSEMFAHAYPALTPSYDAHPDLFQKLWRAAIASQQGQKVVWSLGFRGQGDAPFWCNDPRYQTNEARGKLVSQLIRIQYDLVKKADPDAVCCTNLYGETMELFDQGFLQLPDDVIKVWADNGAGKMVSRRHNNYDPRVPALPAKDGGSHGIYYHVSFYDLQTANHITMLPNSPDFVCRELDQVLDHGADQYWIINCSNVKPHVYMLDLVAQLWREGHADPAQHLRGYVSRYFSAAQASIVLPCFAAYWRCAPAYGALEDQHAGEQFSNHVARMLICQYRKDSSSRAEDLLWATDAPTLEGQLRWYAGICQPAAQGYAAYLHDCERAALSLEGAPRRLFMDSLLLQAKLHAHCYAGAALVCESLLAALAGSYQRAFYLAGKARQAYLAANDAMRACEHGKWHGYYANECLTDVKQTAWVLSGLMSDLRNLGDGPHFYEWQREFLYAEEDRRVMLILNMENHLTDDELFALMDARWGD